MLLLILNINIYAHTEDAYKVSYTVQKIDESKQSIGNNIGYSVTVGDKILKPNEIMTVNSDNLYIYLYENDGKYIDEQMYYGTLLKEVILTMYEYKSYDKGEPKIYENIWAKYKFTFNFEKISSTKVENNASVITSSANIEMPQTGEASVGSLFVIIGIFLIVIPLIDMLIKFIRKHINK